MGGAVVVSARVTPSVRRCPIVSIRVTPCHPVSPPLRPGCRIKAGALPSDRMASSGCEPSTQIAKERGRTVGALKTDTC